MARQHPVVKREATMSAFDEYRGQRTVLLTTRKRDGTTVGTPVHIALGPGWKRLFPHLVGDRQGQAHA